jgi:hypothetical protein
MCKFKEKKELWFVLSIMGGDATIRVSRRDYEPFLTPEQLQSAPIVPDLTEEQTHILSDLDAACEMNCEAFFDVHLDDFFIIIEKWTSFE